jgi:hypothetical protein
MLLSCPNTESLFEAISIPDEMSRVKRAAVHLHTLRCAACRERVSSLRAQWDAYFKPEPDITSSLMKVYSSLQNDETLILKGWKLSPARAERRTGISRAQKGWLFGGGFSLALAAIFVVIGVTGVKLGHPDAAPVSPWTQAAKAPLAQIRFEDENRVKVQYVQPELLQSIEFETSAR